MDILKIGTAFDWISPVLAFIQDIINGPSVTFGIVEGAGWSGHDVERLLRQHGVRTWGLMAVNDTDSPTGGTVLVTVPKAQGRWAAYILEREGVPLAFGPSARPADDLERANRELAEMDGWLKSMEV